MIVLYWAKKEEYGLCFRDLLKRAKEVARIAAIVNAAPSISDQEIVAIFLQQHGDSSVWKGKTAASITLQQIVNYAKSDNVQWWFLPATGTATRQALSELGVDVTDKTKITLKAVRDAIRKTMGKERQQISTYNSV